MPYNNNIPQSNDQISVSQGQILGNFSSIATAFNLNHGDFNGLIEGKHKFVEMPNMNATPPTTAANEVGVYCNTSAFTNQPEMFFIKQNGTTAPAPLNGANGYEVTSSNYIANGGWTRLPSGILLKWGTFATAPGTNTGTVIFPVAATIPPFTIIYNVQVSSAAVGPQYYTTTGLLATQFTITANINGVAIYYLAIGI